MQGEESLRPLELGCHAVKLAATAQRGPAHGGEQPSEPGASPGYLLGVHTSIVSPGGDVLAGSEDG